MFGLLQKILSQLCTVKYGFQQNNVPQTSWDPHYSSAFFAEVYLLLTWRPSWSFWEGFLLIYTTMQHGSRSISCHREAGESRAKRKKCPYPSSPLDEWPAAGFDVSCTGPGSHVPAWVKAKQPGTTSRQPAINYEGGSICKRQRVFSKDRMPVWRRKGSVQFHLCGHFPDTTAPSLQSGRRSVQREQPLRGCMSAACVVKLYVSVGLALLFVFKGKPHHCCYVGWIWPRPFCKWCYFPSYPSPIKFSLVFRGRTLIVPSLPSPAFPFLSCSSSDLYMSQDTIPLRIRFI